MNDKAKHFAVGLLVGLAALPISTFCGLWWALLITLVFGSIIFVGKEISDKFDINFWFYKHKMTGFDKIDLVADYLGWLSGAIVSYFIWGIIQIIKL